MNKKDTKLYENIKYYIDFWICDVANNDEMEKKANKDLERLKKRLRLNE